MTTALLNLGVIWSPSLSFSLQIFPSCCRNVYFLLATLVLWKHINCPATQVYSWQGIWPEDEILTPASALSGSVDFAVICSLLADQKRAPYLVIDGCEPPCGCWELISGPLEEQSVLLTSEPLSHLSNPLLTYSLSIKTRVSDIGVGNLMIREVV